MYVCIAIGTIYCRCFSGLAGAVGHISVLPYVYLCLFVCVCACVYLFVCVHVSGEKGACVRLHVHA